jgi:hypothetical protein
MNLSSLDEGQSLFDVLILSHRTSGRLPDLERHDLPLQLCRLFGQLFV